MKRFGADLLPRILSAIVLIPVTVFALILGAPWLSLLVGLFFAGAFHEWDNMVLSRHSGRAGNVATGLLAMAGLAMSMGGIYAALAMLAAAGLVLLIFGGDARFWRLAGALFFGLVIIAIVSMRGHAAIGIIAGLFLACTIWGTDTGAYFTGRLLGGAKLSPDISPAKTWSGAFGGMALGTITALIVWIFATSSPWWIGLALAVILSIAGQMGDLAESAMKRRFHIKDSGDILPGHGGLMDRIDSLSLGALTLFIIGALHADTEHVAQGFLIWG